MTDDGQLRYQIFLPADGYPAYIVVFDQERDRCFVLDFGERGLPGGWDICSWDEAEAKYGPLVPREERVPT